MNAGPELDRLVAEKVMGWSVKEDAQGYSEIDRALMGGGMMSRYQGWSPSRNPEDIWDVVDRMRSDGFSFSLWQPGDREGMQAIVSFICSKGPCEKHGNPHHNHHGAYDIEAESAPLAVCLAALKALKVTGESS